MPDEIIVETPQFPRGAKPTPRHILCGAEPFRPVPTLLAPTQFAVVPKQLSMWLNNQTGDCVTAEEAFAKAAWAVMNGLPELFIPDAEVGRWAQKYGYYDGAMLPDVMGTMAKDGFTVNGVNYHDGGYQSVNYGDEPTLQAALLQGPVKIGIDANALPSGAGNGSGWYAVGGSPGQFQNEDHCVGLCGFGPAGWLYQQLGVPLPSALSATQTGYLLFTWSSIGFVDHAWLMSTCAEAWIRNPTTPEQAPTPTPPSPPSPPVPPVPPTPPAPVTLPNYSISGNVPSGLWGTLKPFTATATPVSSIPTPHSIGGAIPWLVLIPLIAKVIPIVIADVMAGKTFSQIVSDVFAALFPAGVRGQIADLKGWTPEQWQQAITAVVNFILALFGLQSR